MTIDTCTPVRIKLGDHYLSYPDESRHISLVDKDGAGVYTFKTSLTACLPLEDKGIYMLQYKLDETTGYVRAARGNSECALVGNERLRNLEIELHVDSSSKKHKYGFAVGEGHHLGNCEGKLGVKAGEHVPMDVHLEEVGEKSDKKLSTGAIIGIVVGSVVFVIVIILAIVFIARRRSLGNAQADAVMAAASQPSATAVPVPSPAVQPTGVSSAGRAF